MRCDACPGPFEGDDDRRTVFRLGVPATQPTAWMRRFQGEYVLLLPPLPEAPLQKFVYEPPDAGKDEVPGRGCGG